MKKTPLTSYTIRFSDCDLFGHLNNARYIDYFLNAREDHLKDFYNIELSNFYARSTSWVVGGHEISYLRPAVYGEIVNIQTSLLKAADDQLFVEMLMFDHKQTHLKSLLWTTFIPVNVKTGKRQNHDPEFMDFARSIERDDVNILQGLKERIVHLKTEIKGQNNITPVGS